MARASRPATGLPLRPVILLLTLCLAILPAGGAGAQITNEITYVYDELGRLVGVVDPAGETATYEYDAVGNLLSISRRSSALVSVIEFTPNGGPVGATVTLYGTGFSTTPGQNAVTFNGVTATVTSATSTRIVTAVPAGATTGPIGVTTPSGSATSGTAFTVGDSGVPTITGFSPTIGVPGTAVSITGTNFETAAQNNRVKFNVARTDAASATATSVSTSVPSGAGSGRITVGTPAGTAASAADFFIPPSPYAAGDVVTTGRMSVGESKAVAVGTANKIGLVVFDGAAGQRVCLKISGVAMGGGSVEVKIRKTGGGVLASTASGSSGAFIDTQTLPATGTYTIQVDPTGTATGSATLTLYDVAPDVAGPITPGGPPVTAATTTPGQNVHLTFSGAANQRVFLKVSGVSMMGGTNNWVNVSLKKPDGAILASTTVDSSGGFIDTQTLPVAGTYTVLADPTNTSTGSVTLTLYDVPPDVTGTIISGGSSVTVMTNAPGQNAMLTFDGAANQRVSLNITSVAMTGGTNNWVNVSIKKPDGTNLATTTVNSGGGFIDAQTLPTSGVYAVTVDPTNTSTGSVTLTLFNVAADVTGPIVPGGSAVTVTTTTPGQNALLTFSGTASQRISLGVSGVTVTGNSWVTIKLKKPDGTTLVTTTVDSGGGFIDTKTLTVTGTYTVLVDLYETNTGSVTLTLHDVPADVTGTITVGGAAVGVTVTIPGQNAGLTFGGVSGQQVTVRVTGNTMNTVTVKLLKPDGSQLTSKVSSSSSFNLLTQTLPATGTYTISIDPSAANTGSLSVSVTNP